ncbi:translation elongation factor [Sphaerisporangium rufum]|uniref:Translation elongation factor n=1 Tax=Sphaerisporangium rufum TaxID=1381558 RepID=A0A919R0L1_9ACTN|nr:SelB C-terminal domain-containing protein [Sphaerisporangium rufum]GII77163.1 translation elongation factor [Sphaerisporangium rufum]
MHVIATAGHVDHGKSTLVRALTGMEPDRLAEERRRGLTIELGYAWTTLPSGARLALVDVPGHERFLSTMLAGAGPVPAALLVVAADEGWMPQSEEHLLALEALGVRHVLLAVTRSDLADPGPATRQALARLAAGGLPGVPAVAVSGRTGTGLAELTAELDRLAARLPGADPAAPARLWVDRVFTVRGSGTVVTGTLPAGRIRAGDELSLDGTPVRVRGLQTLKEQAESVTGVARVAVNLRGAFTRGTALVTPGAWTGTDLVDVRLTAPGPRGDGGTAPPGGRPGPAAGGDAFALPAEVTAHIGSAAVTCRVRPLGAGTARLRLARPLPLHVGDVLVLRDPGRPRELPSVVAGAAVLDVRPPALRRRGAARARAAELAAAPGAAALLRTHRFLPAAELAAMGVKPPGPPVAGDWHADPELWQALPGRLAAAVGEYAAHDPMEPGMPVEAARRALGLPDRRLVAALIRPPLTLAAGRITTGGASGLPAPVAAAVDRLRAELAGAPFRAPEADRLAALGLGRKEIAAAVRAGALLRIAEGVVLLPGADRRAAALLAGLPQPFTVSQARQALDTSRRVAVPLLEHLERARLTTRTDDGRHRCRPVGA